MQMYTEDEIRAVMEDHHPGVDWDVGLRCMAPRCTEEWSTDHFLEELKAHRQANRPALHPCFGDAP